jgi:hypothetical protein
VENPNRKDQQQDEATLGRNPFSFCSSGYEFISEKVTMVIGTKLRQKLLMDLKLEKYIKITL